jgi:hypothetical protein
VRTANWGRWNRIIVKLLSLSSNFTLKAGLENPPTSPLLAALFWIFPRLACSMREFRLILCQLKFVPGELRLVTTMIMRRGME